MKEIFGNTMEETSSKAAVPSCLSTTNVYRPSPTLNVRTEYENGYLSEEHRILTCEAIPQNESCCWFFFLTSCMNYAIL